MDYKLKKIGDFVYGNWSWESNMVMSDRGCRIIVRWNPLVMNIMLVYMCDQAMLYMVENISMKTKFYSCFTDVANKGKDKKNLWKTLKVYNHLVNGKPWILMGDWNVSLNVTDHSKGGIASTLKEYCDAVSDKEKLLFQRNKSRITMINNEFGETFYDDKVPEPFVIHFREFLGKSQTIQLCLLDKIHFDKMISQNKADWMTRQVTNKEIKHATFNIDDNKAPDLDNFSYRFYKKSWEIIGKDVCAVVKEFFKKGKMLGEVNATLISLIPELDIPTKFSKSRPIACL
ncbi:RNA-directed DNA polymerase, eukaryota, reverse transcriptase zinc-binding domain protein [Tanacetum coccineum]